MPDTALSHARYPLLHGSLATTAASNAHTLVSTVLIALAGLLYIVIPGALTAAAVGVVDRSAAPVWAAGLVCGGVLASVGIVGQRPRCEVIGLGLAGGAVTFAALAIVDVRQSTAWPTAVIYLSVGLSAFARMVLVVHLERVRERAAAAARRARSHACSS